MNNTQAATLLTATMLIAGSYADTFGTGANQFSIDFVNIGYAGNVADTVVMNDGTTGYGAVGYDYSIGQKEVTIDQFFKARAADSRISSDIDPEGYWNTNGRTVGTNAPASYVSVYEAMKFANFLTTGNAHTGAYQFSDSGVFMAVDRAAAVSGFGTVYLLPNEDEWYKAAYYKPVNDGSYSLYSNGSDDLGDLIWGTANGWNYRNESDQRVNSAPNYMWETGYGAEEQNGTYDMMGNIWEWTENAAVRGGSAHRSEDIMRASSRETKWSNDTSLNIGFRIAAIPEPSSIAMIGLIGGFTVFVRRIFMI